MAQVPVTEQHVLGAVLYSYMIGTVQAAHEETMGKVGTSETWTVNINFWNDGSTLYFMFICPDATAGSHDWLQFSLDQEDLASPCNLFHDGALVSGTLGSWEDGHFFSRGMADGDYYWDGYWSADTEVPGHTLDQSDSWSTSAGWTTVLGTIPLNGHDTLDLNVKSGAVLGLYIGYDDDATEGFYVWPMGSAPYTDYYTDPTEWGDLWTEKVYTAVVPHAADEPGAWIAYLGLMNNGLETARVYFQFYDGAGNEVSHATETVPSRAHFGEYVRNIPGFRSFSGSIVITSDQPFTGQLNQHRATLASFAMFPFTGHWI